MKHICKVLPSNVDKKTHEGELPVRLCNYTDVYHQEVITADLELMQASATPEQVARFTLRAGDTIITKDSETADDIAIAAYVPEDLPGVVCGYHLAMVRPHSSEVHGRYIKRFFDSSYARMAFEVRANGLTRVGLSQYDLDNVDVPVPPLDEQRAIAEFLDRETGRIDALVAEQERLIELLEEKRISLVSHHIIAGPDPEASRSKDSEIPWIGRVPSHWSIVPLMKLTQQDRPIMYGIVLPGPDVGPSGIPILKGGNVRPGRMNLGEMARTTAELERPYARARLRTGDLVYSIRGTIGDCEEVPAELDGANITQDVARVAPSPQANARWLRWALLTPAIREELASGSLGAAVRGINIFDLKRVRIPVPPRAEQDRIAETLDCVTREVDVLIGRAKQSIGLLAERRAALITAAVTGQIDVRGPARTVA